MNALEPAAPTSVENFFACDLRVGTVIACEPNAKARKPAYKLVLDFGPLGHKSSSAQVTERYRPEDLIGKQVVAVVNFPPRKVADVLSECLVLAVDSPEGLVTLSVERPVANGVRVY
jgi:tRNA-binding protein